MTGLGAEWITVKNMSNSLIPSFIIRLLNKNEWCEQIAQVAHQKWAMWANHSGRLQKMSDVSKSLQSLTKNERQRAIHSGHSPKVSESIFFWVNHSFDHYLIICWQKMSNLLRKSMSEFPTMVCIIRRSQALPCASYHSLRGVWLLAVLANFGFANISMSNSAKC